MDCRNFKDLLDSYLSAELAVETNHAMLCHTENCPSCRNELAGRRRLREALQRACSQEKMSEEACERLRARLRAEAEGRRNAANEGKTDRLQFLERLKKGWAGLAATPQWTMPVAAVTAILLFVGGVYLLRPAAAAELSPALVEQAAGDHRSCGRMFSGPGKSAGMPLSTAKYNRAYPGLSSAAPAGALGLQLKGAHVCNFDGRSFAHLVYARDAKLISLLVTERDAQAVKSGRTPADAGDHGDWSRFFQSADAEHLPLGAYQTARHVVIVVSDLPEAENRILARQLGTPIVEYLRRDELTARVLRRSRGGKLGRQEAGGRKQEEGSVEQLLGLNAASHLLLTASVFSEEQ